MIVVAAVRASTLSLFSLEESQIFNYSKIYLGDFFFSNKASFIKHTIQTSSMVRIFI